MIEIRFACQPGCIRCCDKPGWVYLTEEDVRRAADYLHLPQDDFERRYLYRTRHLRRLRKPPGRQCVFLGETGCGIHPAKPTQCRAYPFWPEIFDDPMEWRELTADCPGVGQGNIVPLEDLLRSVEEMRSAYPRQYGPT